MNYCVLRHCEFDGDVNESPCHSPDNFTVGNEN
jgi:hypothetical protein